MLVPCNATLIWDPAAGFKTASHIDVPALYQHNRMDWQDSREIFRIALCWILLLTYLEVASVFLMLPSAEKDDGIC